MGFVKKGKYYALDLPVKDIARRIILIKKLIALEALFANGKDWAPTELIDHYIERGIIDSKYYKISWKDKDDVYIVLK